MQIPHELIPMFITLTGARDRAKHEQKKIGNVYCRAATEITLVGVVSTPPSEAVAQRIADLQKQAQLIIKHTINTMANDISFLLENDGAATVDYDPQASVLLVPEDNPELFLIRQDFIDAIQHDAEAAEAMSHVTADLVDGWQG